LKTIFRPRSIKLRTKIIAWSFVPTAIILLLVALTTYYAYQRVTEENAIQRDIEVTRLSAAEISSGFEDSVDRLTRLARMPAVYGGSGQSQRKSLDDQKNQLIFFDGGVVLLDNLGVVSAALPDWPEWIGQDWSNRPYFRQMLRATVPYFSDIVPDGPGGVNVIVFAVPIMTENNEMRGEALGMFRLDQGEVSSFYGTILKQRVGSGGTAYVMDGNGRLIFATDFAQIGKDYTTHPVAAQALGGQVGAKRIRALDGRDTVASYAPVPSTHWSLVVEENWADLVRPSRGYGPFLLGLLALGVIIPTIVVPIGLRRITGPINDFIRAAQRIAEGDFDQEIRVNTGDELEELAMQFNAMADQLQASYATLENRVAERTRELTALNAVAEVVSRSLDLERILADGLIKTLEVMKMDAGLVYRLDPDTQMLILEAQQGLDGMIDEQVEHLPLESSVAKVVVETHKPIARLVSDYPVGTVRSGLERVGFRLVVCIPLLAQDSALGTITTFSRTENIPTQEEMAVAAAVGQQIGVAMDNARLFAQTVEYAHAMEAARQAAEDANASKSIFVANVSHELRTPLTSILGFARMVQKRLDERIYPNTDLSDPRNARVANQVQENLKIIMTEGERLTTLINNVLDLEKIEAGKMEWRMGPIQISEVIEQATNATAALFETQPLALVIDYPKMLPQVNGDRDRLVQVLINLMSNAVKFTRQGEVTLRVRENQRELVISISDTGIGIAAEDIPLVFEKFKQVGNPLMGKPRGTGLGLSICKEIVERHGGRIWVESMPGQGSTFSFTLPVLEAQSEVPEREPLTAGDKGKG
jgi:signal transduction histidine kinase